MWNNGNEIRMDFEDSTEIDKQCGGQLVDESHLFSGRAPFHGVAHRRAHRCEMNRRPEARTSQ